MCKGCFSQDNSNIFLNSLCGQSEFQISKSDTHNPEILSFLHLNAKEGQ